MSKAAIPQFYNLSLTNNSPDSVNLNIGHIRCADTIMKSMNGRLQIIRNQSVELICPLSQIPTRENLSLTEKQEMATLDNNWTAVDALMPKSKKSAEE